MGEWSFSFVELWDTLRKESPLCDGEGNGTSMWSHDYLGRVRLLKSNSQFALPYFVIQSCTPKRLFCAILSASLPIRCCYFCLGLIKQSTGRVWALASLESDFIYCNHVGRQCNSKLSVRALSPKIERQDLAYLAWARHHCIVVLAVLARKPRGGAQSVCSHLQDLVI